ncbi:hypothetical protein [Aquimarina sp. I32.4]|uniref:hypothetical protein n=1 Tax=Aquimarina sp. I32.4 TaxID=2053903 RepID=UPI000CDE5D61|nr:hypothetical protein [Aquimarina sp. I32.4]
MITSKELNLSKFSITPGNDIKLSYVDGKTNLYTINNATGDKEELLHYTVSITKEAVIVPETLELTSFKFEKSKNPNLPNDIEIARTVENLANDKIYLFVPVGTDFTNLVPTITYTGTTLHYHEGPLRSSVEKIYTENTSMNFKYPNSILLEIKNKDNDKSKTINVIVDVINPLKIEETFFNVYLSDGVLRADHVIQWTNQGNHLLEYAKEYTQENQDPVGIHYLFNFYRTIPSGGLAPGDSDHIFAAIDFPLDHPEGVYKTTAVFYPRIKDNAEIDDLLEPARMDVIAHFVW